MIRRVSSPSVALEKLNAAATKVIHCREKLAAAVAAFERASQTLCGELAVGESSARGRGAGQVAGRGRGRPVGSGNGHRGNDAATEATPRPRPKQPPAFRVPPDGSDPADIPLSRVFPSYLANALADLGMKTADDLVQWRKANSEGFAKLLGDGARPRQVEMLDRLTRRYLSAGTWRRRHRKPDAVAVAAASPAAPAVASPPQTASPAPTVAANPRSNPAAPPMASHSSKQAESGANAEQAEPP